MIDLLSKSRSVRREKRAVACDLEPAARMCRNEQIGARKISNCLRHAAMDGVEEARRELLLARLAPRVTQKGDDRRAGTHGTRGAACRVWAHQQTTTLR
jgi:hypothetical protein